MRLKLLVLDAFLAASLVVLKEVLAFLPNVELVTLFLIIFALNLPLKDSLLIAFIYATLEGLLYGFNIFSLSYYLVFILIVFLTPLFIKEASYLKIAVLSFFYGLFFDVIFALPLVVNGLRMVFAYLLNGLLFSLVHAVMNFILALFLYERIDQIFKTCLERYGFNGLK